MSPSPHSSPQDQEAASGSDFFGAADGAALASASKEMLNKIWESNKLGSDDGEVVKPAPVEPPHSFSNFVRVAVEKLVEIEDQDDTDAEEVPAPQKTSYSPPPQAYDENEPEPEKSPEPKLVLQPAPEPIPALEQAERVVDILFERMEDVLEARLREINERAKDSASALDTEVRHNIAQFVQAELPVVIREELSTVLRAEMDRSVAGAVATESRKESSSLDKHMEKLLEKFEALDRRMLHLEGRKHEIIVNLPKGAVNVTAPITIPEREVKVMAPITVHPPEVRFDEAAINVIFQKTGDKVTRKIDFERDRDNNIKSAQIADVPKKST